MSARGSSGARGARPAYSAEEIEKALLFGKVCGYRTYSKTHMRLCADSHVREALGFTRSNAQKKASRYQTGVPSRATICRHLKRFGHERRGDAWDKLALDMLRDFHVANFPEMQEEMRVSNTDGTAIKTHYTAPIFDRKTGELINAKRVTCWDGGYKAMDAGDDRSGAGWNLIPFLTHTSVPWAWSLPKMQDGESTVATEIALNEAAAVMALIPMERRKLGVMTADSNFRGKHLRRALREIGMIDNIHTVSHKRASRDRAEDFRADQHHIEGYPNWFTDGHRQLYCACGNGYTFARAKLRSKGRAVARVEGSCTNCGSITVTSGKWKLAANPRRWKKVNLADPLDVAEADPLMGNPLTFDDPLSNAFGNRRFWHCEGLFGTLWKRWRLGDKRWFRTVHQAEAEIGMVFSIIHVVAMEQRRRKELLALAPPGSP